MTAGAAENCGESVPILRQSGNAYNEVIKILAILSHSTFADMEDVKPLISDTSPRESSSADHVLSLDVGTTTVKCCIFDSNGASVARTTVPIKSKSPHPGWVEIEPDSLWSDVKGAMAKVLVGELRVKGKK